MHARRLLISTAIGMGLVMLVGLLTLPGDVSRNVHAQGADKVGTYYVAPGGNCGGAAPCYSTIQAAVDAADHPDDVVKVAAGTYTDVHARPKNDFLTNGNVVQVVYVNKTVTIRGGYTTANGFADPPDPDANPTILDAQGQGRGVYISGDISPIVEGLRVTGGDATGLGGNVWIDSFDEDAGGGIYIYRASATISNCKMYSNTASTGIGYSMGWGGGVHIVRSSATLIGNKIVSNTACMTYVGFGGGVAIWWDSHNATLIDNTIQGNLASTYSGNGGGLSIRYSDAILLGNTVISNTAATGSTYSMSGHGVEVVECATILNGNIIAGNDGNGVYLLLGTPTLSSNIITDNDGNGVNLWQSPAILNGNTVSRNSGNGTYLYQSSAALVRNSISHNGSWGISLDGSTATLYGNIISNNASGLQMQYSNDTMLVNNAIVDNNDYGIVIDRSSADLLHTTIARNGSSGIYVTGWPSSTASISNTILVSHTTGIEVAEWNVATLNGVLWYGNGTNISGTGTIAVSNAYTGTPAFDADGYHLLPSSMAIDHGVSAGVTADIDPQPRPYQIPDLGTDEYWPPGELKYFYLPGMLQEEP